mmetsp:Transcript_120675/g.346726  ORF Transcript_120675/g.346726 Transcript_120675/m.346726 type:complete len:219 (-) Transcript_120675:1218-1874(-)
MYVRRCARRNARNPCIAALPAKALRRPHPSCNPARIRCRSRPLPRPARSHQARAAQTQLEGTVPRRGRRLDRQRKNGSRTSQPSVPTSASNCSKLLGPMQRRGTFYFVSWSGAARLWMVPSMPHLPAWKWPASSRKHRRHWPTRRGRNPPSCTRPGYRRRGQSFPWQQCGEHEPSPARPNPGLRSRCSASRTRPPAPSCAMRRSRMHHGCCSQWGRCA